MKVESAITRLKELKEFNEVSATITLLKNEAINMAIEALEKQTHICEPCRYNETVELVGKADKYRWHDLRKNPEELPEAWGFTEEDIYSLIVNVYTDKFSFPLVGYMNTETKEWFFPLEERTFKDCDLGNVVKWSNIRSFKDEK